MDHILFVIEFLQQYVVLNLDQDTQLMLTVDYEAKRYCKRILDNAYITLGKQS